MATKYGYKTILKGCNVEYILAVFLHFVSALKDLCCNFVGACAELQKSFALVYYRVKLISSLLAVLLQYTDLRKSAYQSGKKFFACFKVNLNLSKHHMC